MNNKLPTIILEHIAIWTSNLEVLKEYYTRFFGGVANEKYTNPKNKFESYFIRFGSGARLELMSMPGLSPHPFQSENSQQYGIIHIAFGVERMEIVDAKARELADNGYPILSGPRKTGDGYYEFETLDPDNNRLEVTAIYP